MAALRSLALADGTIAGLVQGRVFVNEISRSVIEAEDVRHPKKTLVLRMGGGGAKADLLPLTDSIVNAVCYGENDFEADRLRRVVYQRFHDLARELVDDVLIHHANPTGGSFPTIEPDLRWPGLVQGFTVKADVLEVA